MAGSAVTASAPASRFIAIGNFEYLAVSPLRRRSRYAGCCYEGNRPSAWNSGRTSSDPDISQLSCFRPQCQQGAHVPHPYYALAGRRRRLRPGLRGWRRRLLFRFEGIGSGIHRRGPRMTTVAHSSPCPASTPYRNEAGCALLRGAPCLAATAMPCAMARLPYRSDPLQPILAFFSATRPRWSSRLKALRPVRKRPSSLSRMRSFSQIHTSQTMLVTEGDIGSKLSASRSASI